MPVVVEYWASGLTWGYGADMIGIHACCTGLPAAGNRAVLARAAGPVLVGQGRRDTRAATRGGRATPDEPQAAHVMDRPSGPSRCNFSRCGCRRCSTASWWRRNKISAVFHISSCRDSRNPAATRVIRRNTNRRHMIGDHHGRTPGRATLLVRAVDEILGTHTRGSRRPGHEGTAATSGRNGEAPDQCPRHAGSPTRWTAR